MFEGFFFVILGQWFPILFCILGVSKNVHLQGIHIKLPKYQKSPQSYYLDIHANKDPIDSELGMRSRIKWQF